MIRFQRDSLDATSRLVTDVASSSPTSWKGPLGPQQLRLLSHHGLVGLMGAHPSSQLRDPVIGPYTRLVGRQALMVSNLERLMERLDDASIRATVVKGPDLATRIYRDHRHRTFTDVDVLVPEASLSRALDVFASDEAVSTLPRKRPKADKRDIPIQDESGRHFMVDLHWDLFSYSQLRGVAEGATEWAWDNARADPESELGPAFRLPEEAYLAFLCTHALLDHRFRLILFRDLEEVAAGGVKWDEVAHFASRWKLRVFTYLALAMAKGLVGADVPQRFLDDLRPRSLPLKATEMLMARTDIARFDGHRPHPLNLAMVLLHDELSQRVRLLAHAPPAIPTWMKRFGRPQGHTMPVKRRRGEGGRAMILVATDQRRGAEVFGESLAAGLRASGWDADLVALAGSGSDVRVATDVVLSDATPGEQGRLDIGTVVALRRRIRTLKPHVVLANGGSTLRYAYAALLGRRDYPRLVYSSIGEPEYWIRGPVHRAVQRRLHRRADLILAVSAATRSQLVDYVGVSPEQVRVVHTGVPEDLVTIESIRSPQSMNVLFLGNLSNEKNPSVALDVIESLEQKDGSLRLRFVGSGPLQQELTRIAQRRFPEGIVEFTGSVEDVTPHLEWADVLLLPSITEGLPGAVLEAGAAGVPTIAFDVGGTREAVIDGVTGVLVVPGDVEGLSAALKSMSADTELTKRLGEAAREHVARRFTMRHTIEQHIDSFDSVLAPAEG